MAINLSNINISIRDFQAVSSGVINAGEVRLTSDHSIDKVNHHVGWFFSNNTSLSHAEVLAIKDAFVRALSQSGVDAGAIDGIRRQLGLAPMGEKDATLAQRSLKPLSRQEIREILDQHAREINQTVGEGNVTTKITDHLTAVYQSSVDVNKRVGMSTSNSETNFFYYVAYSERIMAPTVYGNPNHYTYASGEHWNPVAILDLDTMGYSKTSMNNYNNSLDLKYDAPFLQGLQFDAFASFNVSQRQTNLLDKSMAVYDYWTDEVVEAAKGTTQYNESWNKSQSISTSMAGEDSTLSRRTGFQLRRLRAK